MKIIALIILSFGLSQEIIEDFLVINGDTLDNFVYQLPDHPSSDTPAPLLVVFHQWGGSAMSTTGTEFDEEAYNRGWYFLSPWGGSANNYNHQQAQYLWEQEISWMMERHYIDPNRIYMVGGSMGGASGAIYANNHLDPTKPMIAGTASASGILDCERRYYEMDGNNSMNEWFGGPPDEFPFEYHRNSAVFFDDINQSMHFNLQYTPLYLDFGVSEPHRGHGEDLYNLLLGYNDNMWIDTDPTGSHGFSVIDEQHACDWLEEFELVSNPNSVRVNLDEPSRAYWIEAVNIQNEIDFINLYIGKDIEENNGNGLDKRLNINFDHVENTDSLILHIMDEWIDRIHFSCNDQLENINIGITGSFLEYVDYYQIIYGWEPQQYPNPGDVIWIDSNTLYCGENDYYYDFYYSIDDVNGDSNWDVSDILLTLNYILGNENITNLQHFFADLNEDNFVNVIDILYMVNIFLN